LLRLGLHPLLPLERRLLDLAEVRQQYLDKRILQQSLATLLLIRKLSLFLISSSEDDDGSSCLLVLARVLPPPRVFRCFGVLTGSIFGLPPHEEGPSAAGSTVS
jgi:hypothetical protein